MLTVRKKSFNNLKRNSNTFLQCNTNLLGIASRIVAANEGRTTGEIIQLIGKNEATAEEIFADLHRFYLAARDSGQLLLRSGTVPLLSATQGRHLYRLEFDAPAV